MAEVLRLPASELLGRIESDRRPMLPESSVALRPPIDGRTPMWAAGVTYKVSRTARIEESKVQDIYERVYDAARPELFFKAQAHDVVTDGDPVGRRSDSTNDTPEPELALVINRFGAIVAYGVANDMSSRSIEGDNPLYLPQAKTYLASAVLGPRLRLAAEIEDPYALHIELAIRRDGQTVFFGRAPVSQLKRTFDELVAYLTRSAVFPDGVVLCTGTCLVPPLDEPTLDGDVVTVAIDSVDSMTNTVSATDRLRERALQHPDWLSAPMPEETA